MVARVFFAMKHSSGIDGTQRRSQSRGLERRRRCNVILLSALQFELYVLNTGGACSIHTSYLDRDRIKRCMTMMGKWGLAGEQLPVVSGTEVIIGEDLIDGQSWTIGVVLLVTVGVVLLSCACIVCYPHVPTGRIVTRKPEVARQPSCMTLRSVRAETINHKREIVESLMVFWRSAVAADGDFECTVLSRYAGILAAQCRLEYRLRWARPSLAKSKFGQEWLPSLAKPSLAKTKFGQTKFGQDQVWPDQVWPRPSLARPSAGQSI